MPSYNYEEAIQLRKEGYTNEECAQHFGYSGEAGFRRRHKREIKSRAKTTIKHKNKSKDNAHTSMKNDEKPPDNDETHRYSSIQIDNAKYGELPVTNYKSELDHDDWIEYYLGYNWRKPYITERRNKIWDSQTIMVLTERFSGKTTDMLGLWARWILEVHQPIFVLGNPIKSGDIWNELTKILYSEKIRKDYGDVVVRAAEDKGIFLVDEMRVDPDGNPMSDPNFHIIGKLSKSVGRHVGMYGWLHLEDIWQGIKVDPSAQKRDLDWVEGTVMFMRGLHGKFTVTATRKDPNDGYKYMMDEMDIPVFLQLGLEVLDGRLPTADEVVKDRQARLVTEWPLVGSYKHLDCPRWPLPALLYQFIFRPTYAYRELNNQPYSSEGNYFSEKDLIEVPRYSDHDAIPKYIMVDPAFGESGSKTAILVLMVRLYRLIIIDMYIGYASADDKIKLLLDFNQKHSPDTIYVENNFNQFTRSMSSDNPLSKLRGIIPFNTDTNKKQRIAHLEYPAKKHEIEVYENCPYKSEFKIEWLTFDLEDSPSEIRQKYNGLDALSMGYKKLNKFMDDYSEQSSSNEWTYVK